MTDQTTLTWRELIDATPYDPDRRMSVQHVEAALRALAEQAAQALALLDQPVGTDREQTTASLAPVANLCQASDYLGVAFVGAHGAAFPRQPVA